MDVSNIENIISPIKNKMYLFEKAFADQFQGEFAFLTPLVQHTLANKGKRLRPILFFLSQGLINPAGEKTVLAAVLLEVLHTATLIHDDVIDSSRLRRGQATFNAQWNNRISILWGDYLFAHVFSIASKTNMAGLTEVISHVVRQIGTGELRQAIIHPKDRLTSDIYLQIIQEKTASLFAASCHLGACAAKADAKQCDNLKNFGLNLGIAFQIRDDILDFQGDPNVMGKPTGQDLSEGILTLPLILALQEAPQNMRDKMIDHLFVNAKQQAAHLEEFVKRYHGLEKASHEVIRFSNQARALLESFHSSPYRDGLDNLIQYNLERMQ